MAKPKKPKLATLSGVLDEYRPPSMPVRICVRADLVARLEELVAAGGDEAQIDKLRDEVAAYECEFVVQSIGALAWQRLLAAHPPTDDQRRRSPGLDHNPLTFPYAAVAASCVAPDGVSDETINELAERLTATQWEALWMACLSVNLFAGTPPHSPRAALKGASGG